MSLIRWIGSNKILNRHLLHQNLNELKSNQDSTSYVSLNNDALTQVFGKDKKGRTRGVGPMSTNKMKAITLSTS